MPVAGYAPQLLSKIDLALDVGVMVNLTEKGECGRASSASSLPFGGIGREKFLFLSFVL